MADTSLLVSGRTYPEWSHRMYIPVTNPSSTADIPTKVTVDYHPAMNADFSDIRFTDKYGTPLKYYRDFYTAGSSARFWVALPANETFIYGYFGNGLAIDESAPESIFTFYDDFEQDSVGSDPSKWTVTEGYNTEVVSSPVYDGSRAVLLEANNAATSNAILKDIGTGEVYGSVGYYWRCAETYESVNVRLQDNGTIGPWLAEHTSDSAYRLHYRDDGIWVSVMPVNQNQWYYIELYFDCSTDTYDIYVDGVLKKTGAPFYSAVSSIDQIKISQYRAGVQHSYIDRVSYRKSVATAPSLSVARTQINPNYQKIIIIPETVVLKALTASNDILLQTPITGSSDILLQKYLDGQNDILLQQLLSGTNDILLQDSIAGAFDVLIQQPLSSSNDILLQKAVAGSSDILLKKFVEGQNDILFQQLITASNDILLQDSISGLFDVLIQKSLLSSNDIFLQKGIVGSNDILLQNALSGSYDILLYVQKDVTGKYDILLQKGLDSTSDIQLQQTVSGISDILVQVSLESKSDILLQKDLESLFDVHLQKIVDSVSDILLQVELESLSDIQLRQTVSGISDILMQLNLESKSDILLQKNLESVFDVYLQKIVESVSDILLQAEFESHSDILLQKDVTAVYDIRIYDEKIIRVILSTRDHLPTLTTRESTTQLEEL